MKIVIVKKGKENWEDHKSCILDICIIYVIKHILANEHFGEANVYLDGIGRSEAAAIKLVGSCEGCR